MAILAGVWALAAFAVWMYLKHGRGFAEVCYTDLALPSRWAEFRIKRGNHYIAQAELRLKERDLAGAIHLLRAGLAKSPANAQGRLRLAGLYNVITHRPDLAREVLLGGLPWLGGDAHYLQTTFQFLSEQEDDAECLRLASSLWENRPEPAIRRLLATHAANAAWQRGNYDLAEGFITRSGLASSSEGILLQARVDWSRGLHDLAVARLLDHLNAQPSDIGSLRQLTDYYRQLGRTADWQTSLVALLAADPLAAGPRLEYLRFLQTHGTRLYPSGLIDEFLAHFAHDPVALTQLAGLAAETGQPAIARHVQTALPLGSDARRQVTLLVAEALITAGEYAESLAALADYAREFPVDSSPAAPALHSLQAIALYGLKRPDEARLHLEALLAGTDLRADALVMIARRLDSVAAREPARLILARAIEQDPLNQAARARLIEIALEANDPASLETHLGPYLRLRQPSRELLARVRSFLGSDRRLFFEPQPRLLAAIEVALHPGR